MSIQNLATENFITVVFAAQQFYNPPFLLFSKYYKLYLKVLD